MSVSRIVKSEHEMRNYENCEDNDEIMANMVLSRYRLTIH